jgi:hypothetical protein
MEHSPRRIQTSNFRLNFRQPQYGVGGILAASRSKRKYLSVIDGGCPKGEMSLPLRITALLSPYALSKARPMFLCRLRNRIFVIGAVMRTKYLKADRP